MWALTALDTWFPIASGWAMAFLFLILIFLFLCPSAGNPLGNGHALRIHDMGSRRSEGLFLVGTRFLRRLLTRQLHRWRCSRNLSYLLLSYPCLLSYQT